jgi:hypothetical protein
MKNIKWMLLSCLVTLMGCAADVIGTSEAAGEPVSDATGVAQTSAALSGCITVRTDNLPSGTIETLNCGGVTCMRTCLRPMGPGGIPGTAVCNTKCWGPQVPATPPALDLSILRTECQIPPLGRINAGWRGISRATCEGEQGACWDNRTTDPKFPWCYEPVNKQPTCGGIAPAERVNAGTRYTTGEQCVRVQGDCWDESIPNVNWCFFHPG